MTEYKVGQRVKIGEAVGKVFFVTKGGRVDLELEAGDGMLCLVTFNSKVLDAMGAVIVPEPIEWKVGDYVEACGSGTIHRYQAHNDMFGAGGTQVARGIVEDGLKRGTWRRVAVTPID